MARDKFGVSIESGIASELESTRQECEDLNASRSEVVEAVLTAFYGADIEHTERIRELIIRRRKGTL